MGSARSGQRARSARTRAGGPASSPATTTVRGPAGSETNAAVSRCAADAWAGPGAGSHRSSGTSGSSSWTLRCTGPAPSVRIAASVSSTRDRSWVATSGPKIPTWSVVWFALVPRRRAGRSAVTTTSGTPACAASSTAGCRLATAVPEVHITAARAPTLVSPTARNPALRSSMRVCSRSRPAAAASYAAKLSGALREPGAITTSVTPASTRVETTARASSVAVFVTSAHPSARPPGRPAPRPAGPPSGRPAPARRRPRPAPPRPRPAG